MRVPSDIHPCMLTLSIHAGQAAVRVAAPIHGWRPCGLPAWCVIGSVGTQGGRGRQQLPGSSGSPPCSCCVPRPPQVVSPADLIHWHWSERNGWVVGAQVDAALWRVERSSLAAYSTGSSPCSCKGIHILIHVHVHVHTSPVNLEETTQTATPDETGQTQAGIGRRTLGSDMRRPQQIHLIYIYIYIYFTHMPSLRSQSCRAKTTQSTRHFLHLHVHQQYPNRNLTTQTIWKTPSDNCTELTGLPPVLSEILGANVFETQGGTRN